MPTTTARAAVVAGITTMMTAYIAANPTLLRRHFRHRPPSEVTDTPYSYMDGRPETSHYDAQTRERVFAVELVFLDQWTEGGEVMDRIDILEDSIISFMSQPTYYHIAGGGSSWWSDLTTTDESGNGRVGFRLRFDVHVMDGSQ